MKMTISLCVITGTWKNPAGVAVVNTAITFDRIGRVTGDGLTIVPSRVVTSTDATGLLAVSLYPGRYSVSFTFETIEYCYRVTVPSVAAITHAELLSQVGAITPAVVVTVNALANAAQVSADQAAQFGNPNFLTLALASAYANFTPGQTFIVWAGFNGEPEEFKYVSDSTLTADGALVLASAMATGRLISTRTVLSNIDTVDRRTFATGTEVQIAFGGGTLQAVASGGTVTNTGGQEYTVTNGPVFTDRTTAALTEASKYPTGTRVSVGGQPMIADDTVPLSRSCGINESVAKLKPAFFVADLKAWGAKGDYDASTETAGQVATAAFDNFAALNAARLYFEHVGLGELVISPDEHGSDYYFSNAPMFQLSNFTLNIMRGVTFRTTVPTSFGTTVLVGEQGGTNAAVVGGGTVRNHLPLVASVDAWADDTDYSVGDYVKNSDDHIYYCQDAGTSTTEPTAVNVTTMDGALKWRDALNDNAISVFGNVTRVIGMDLPESSNKAITAQVPSWSEFWVTGNVVGDTWHDGIEVKGNQAIAGQELLFGKHAWVSQNIVKNAGRVGIEVEQPSFGTNLNENVFVTDNLVIRAGFRGEGGGGHSGIRVNRCTNPVIRGNKVLEADGNGYHIRQCTNVTGDIFAETFGIFGVNLEDNAGYTFSSVTLLDPQGAYEVIRDNGTTKNSCLGSVRVEGSGHTYAYRELSKPSGVRITATSLALTIGSSGVVFGSPPDVAVFPKTANGGVTHVGGTTSLGGTSRYTVLDVTSGGAECLGGVITGNSAMRLEIYLDSASVETISIGGGNDLSSITIPPMRAFETFKIVVNNNSGSSGVIDYSMYYRV